MLRQRAVPVCVWGGGGGGEGGIPVGSLSGKFRKESLSVLVTIPWS